MIAQSASHRPELPFLAAQSFAKPKAPSELQPLGDLGSDLASALVEVLHGLEHGVVLVRHDAGMEFANRTAEELIGAQRGLLVRNGVLRAEACCETLALHKAIRLCASERPAVALATSLRIGQGGEGTALSVLVTPIRTVEERASGAVAAVHISDPQGCELPTVRELRDLLGLTPAEAALARDMAAGDGLQATARRLGISPATARTHLNHCFEKTGTRRQAELVRLVLTLRPRVHLR